VVSRQLEGAAGKGFHDHELEGAKPGPFSRSEHGRLVTYITVGLIVFVAALNILISLIMMVMEKTKDIAGADFHGDENLAGAQNIHRAGSSDWSNRHRDRLIPGYAISYAGGHYHMIRSRPSLLHRLRPLAPRVKDGLWVVLVSVGVSFIATLNPSWSARQDFTGGSVALRIRLCGLVSATRSCGNFFRSVRRTFK